MCMSSQPAAATPEPGPRPAGRAVYPDTSTLPALPWGPCLLEVAVPVLAEGLEDHGADGHERLHHAELQGGLGGAEAESHGADRNHVTDTSSGREACTGCQGVREAQCPLPRGRPSGGEGRIRETVMVGPGCLRQGPEGRLGGGRRTEEREAGDATREGPGGTRHAEGTGGRSSSH